LIQLLISQKQIDRARQELATLTLNRDLAPPDQRRLAYFYAQTDQPDQAVSLLQNLHQAGRLDEIGTLQLAEIQRQAGRTDQALALCQPLLDNPSPAVIEFAADLFASLGQLDRSQTLLAKLDALTDLPPKRKLAIRAGFAMRHGTPDQAMDLLTQLAHAQPPQAQDWTNLISFAVRAGRIDDALTALAQAADGLPNDPAITDLAAQAPTLRQLGDDNTVIPLLAALIDQPQDRPQILPALTLLTEAKQKNLPDEQLTAQLAQLADRYPTLVALQNLVIRRYLAQNQPADAARLAQRAMDRFPRAVEPAWLAAEAFAAQKKWADALAAAEQWRKRSASRPLAADVMIAQAQLELDRPEQADAHMQQYLQWALQNPDAYSPVIVNHTRALIHQGHPDQAHDLLWPLTEKTPAWRLAWMQMAANELPTETLARQWLTELQPRLPDDDSDQRLTLGQAWIVAGRRLSADALKDQGFALLAALADDPNTSPETLFNIARAAEIEERLDDAEKYYRLSLARRKDFDVSMNNLAMLLIQKKGDLHEALALAQAAVKARPDSPDFLDTQAYAQQALAQFDPAADSLRKAIELDPANLEWQAHLVQVLRQAGKTDDADQLAAKLRQADPELKSIPDHLRPAVAP
ncbi:MAG: tetratricopeptide repeat protein, partial [Phycisphaeraceae bacterium]|nr:tetratricopeptide repeat protein [Phycisphaeraceae bacterium]